MSENEIDSLEIVVEAEANRANRALSGLEKRINKAATALEKFMVMAQGGISFKNVDVDKLFSGNAMDSAARKQGKKLADELISGFNLNKSGAEVQRQVRELTQKIAGGLSANGGKPYSGLSTDLEALGKITAKNGSVAKSTSEEYQKLYNWIKTTSKIKITPETAKSLGDTYKNRVPVMKQKLSTKSGIELDSFYNEAKDMFPGLLKDANNVEDEFYQLDSALEKFYETSNSFYKPEWMEDAAYDSVISGVNEIVASIEKAKSESSDLTGSLKGVADTGKSFSDIFGAGMDTSGLERIVELTGSVRSQSSSGRANRSDLKYTEQSLDDIYDKYANVGSSLDASGMGLQELQKKLKNSESTASRLRESLKKKISIEGTDRLGKTFEKLIYDIQKATNEAEVYKSAIDKISEEKPELTITRNGKTYNASNGKSVDTEDTKESAQRSSDAVEELSQNISNIDKDGNITKTSRKFDGVMAKVRELKNELTKGGFGNYTKNFMDMLKLPEKETKGASQKKAPTVDSNGNYDYSAIEKYVNSFGEASSAAENFRSKLQTLKGALGVLKDGVVNSRVAKMASALKNATVHSLKFAKSIGKISLKTLSKIPSIVKTASKPLKALGSAIGSAGKKLGLFQKSSNKGMSFGRMIGSSIMFSTIFGAISQIKQAVKEGSDNLVQYSSEYNNSISSMVSSLLYLKNAWAVAFAPIVNVVGPYISSFIDMVAGALNAVGQLMASLTGKSYVVQAKKAWKDYAAGLDTTKNSADDAGKSIKDLENYTLGIDELNVIQPSDNSGSSGSGSGSGSGSTSPSSSDVFATTDVDGGISELAKKIKEAWKNADFTEIGGIVGRKLEDALDNIPWDGIQEKAIKIGKSLGTFINGAVETQGLGTTLGQTIGEAVNTGIYCANAFLDNTKWDEVGKFIGDGFNGLLDTIDFTAWGHYFAQKWNAVFATIGEAARTFDWTQLGVNLAEGVNTFVADFDWVENGARLSDTVKGLLDAIITFLEETDWQQIGEKCADFIGAIDWIGIAEKIAEGIGAAVGGLSALVWGFIKDAWEDVVKWWKDTAFEDGKFTITGLLDGILEKIKDIGTWVKEHIVDPFIDGFCEAFGIHSPSTVMKEKGNFIMDGLIGGVTDKFQSVIDFFSNLKDSIVEKFDDVKDWFGKKFDLAREQVENKFSNIGTWFSDRKKDIQNNMNSVSDWFNTKFKGARSFVTSAFQNIGSWFGDKRTAIQNNMGSISTWFRDTFRRAYNGITGIFDNIGSYFRGIGDKIKSPIRNALNGVIGGVNWVLGKLGSGKTYPYVNFATGTDGVAHDTLGVVNDQTGSTYRELVQFPNGKTIIPRGRNVMLPMPKGTKVLPADQTKALMRMQNIPHFKSGIGDFFGNAWAKIKDFTGDILDYVENPRKLMQIAIDKFTDLTGALEPGLSMAKGAVNSVFDAAVNSIKGLLSDFGGTNVKYNPSAGVEQWRKLAKKALKLTGQYSESNLNRLLMQMQSESSGNPNAINNWDSNAKAGIPSKGLMQVIDPTFRSYALAPYNKNIYDPLSNMIAAIRYTVSKYGSLSRGWNGHGYANGGFPMNGEVYVANENGFGSEYIGSIGNRHVVANNNQIVESVSSGVERANDETNALLRTVIEYQKLILKKDTSVNMDGKRMDKQISKARRNTGFSFSPT